jgi:hypothetical protein
MGGKMGRKLELQNKTFGKWFTVEEACKAREDAELQYYGFIKE